jgi:hypothetical protein
VETRNPSTVAKDVATNATRDKATVTIKDFLLPRNIDVSPLVEVSHHMDVIISKVLAIMLF